MASQKTLERLADLVAERVLEKLRATDSGGAVSRANAAKYLGVSTRMLDKYAEAGTIRRVKQGTKTTYRVADLNAFLNRCAAKSSPEDTPQS